MCHGQMLNGEANWENKTSQEQERSFKKKRTEIKQMGRNLPKYEGEYILSHGSVWCKNQELKKPTR